MFDNKKDKQFWINVSPFFLAIILTLIIATLLRFLPSRLPLFYSLPWGDGQLATREQFLILPAIISLITLLNLTLSWQLHPSQIFFKKILFFSSLVTSLILVVTFIKIIIIFA